MKDSQESVESGDFAEAAWGRGLALAICGPLATAAVMLLAACGQQRSSPPAKAAPRVSVVTLHAQSVPMSSQLPGRVAAYRTAEVRPQVSGIVLKRLFVEGSEVRAGQQLYQIDPAPYQASYDSAVAVEASARALAERYKLLVAANAVSKQDYDNAEASYLQARAGVETARINLVYTRVLSPIAGRIGRSMITEGALVTANQATALATVQQLDRVYVDVTQPSAALVRLQRESAAGLLRKDEAGQTRVQLQLEDGSDYAHPGTLQFSEVTVDPGTGSVTLRALVPNPERLLLPGMFVREQIQEGVRQGTVLVPQQAVGHDQRGSPSALVVGPDNVVQLRVLQADRAVGDRWVVTAGLAVGDRVVVEGIQFARPGAKVLVDEYAPAVAEGHSNTQASAKVPPPVH
ncbi:MAG TPA: efflux RND transporter periplasmic adaptor subunit [Steroidobacteraceae bacterium]|nr:efflux RND transporter periplasmic adaptor subunit [Steroidobacteraceae bacterium]